MGVFFTPKPNPNPNQVNTILKVFLISNPELLMYSLLLIFSFPNFCCGNFCALNDSTVKLGYNVINEHSVITYRFKSPNLLFWYTKYPVTTNPGCNEQKCPILSVR